MYMAVREAEEFVKASEGTEETQGQMGLIAVNRWIPPATGWVKVIFDGAWVNRDGGPKEGAAFVIWDGSGRFIATRSVNLGVVSSALCAEALACRGALFFALEPEMESIVVVGESLQIVQMAGKKRHCNKCLFVQRTRKRIPPRVYSEAMLGIIAKKAGEIAVSQIIKESSRFSWVREDLLWIETEMRRIQSYLEDAEAKQFKTKGVSNFIREIQDLAYDVEDIIDTYFAKISLMSRTRWKRLLDFRNMRFAHGFVKEVEGIRKRVEDIKNSRQTFGIDECSRSCEEDTWDLRQSFPHFDEPNVVGFDDLIKILVHKVLDEDSHHRVVSIVGFPGLGKTTLARKVYNSAWQSKVYKSHPQRFDCAAWICVSECPNEKGLLRDIAGLVGLEKEKMKHNVETNLYEFLSRKRCVIVINDIWHTRAWDAFKIALPMNSENGSRIVLTPRHTDVGVHVGGPNSIILLESLDQETSRRLFYKLIVDDLQNSSQIQDPPQLEKIANLQTLHRLPGDLFKADWLHKITSLRTLQVKAVNKDIIGVLSDAAPVSHKLEEMFLVGHAKPLLETASLNLVRYDNLLELLIWNVKLNDLSHDKLPPNPTELTLFWTHLTTNPIEALKKLQKLKFLELRYYSFLGKELVFSGEPSYFPQLEVLKIEYMPNLERVVVEEGGLPRLRDFMIRNCSPETLLPDRVRNAMRTK
ncbi:hypothetical protein RHSIM_Rhsim05G0157200 [Rhododendron simsii]|uniref:Uncharacterized protein n=1 Tax=Rhododendron simsii TaxID=118357 RepID=A0A834GYS8_RHOSS|nr:hypothetical protein RHSIM_Rhsim05G0157200 [Rhododendron simsii]